MSKSNYPEATLGGKGKVVTPEKESGRHETGKDRSAEASRRDNHPAKRETRKEHEALVADHSISGFDTGTNDAFPKKSTGAKEVKK